MLPAIRKNIPEMRALKNIDVAFVPMNLPYTMPPSEAAACVKAFKPKIVYPYHYMGSDLKEFQTALNGSGVTSASATGTRNNGVGAGLKAGPYLIQLLR